MQLDHTHPVLAGAGYHLPLRGALLGRGAGQRRARRCGPFPSGQTPRGPHTSAPELSGEPVAQVPTSPGHGQVGGPGCHLSPQPGAPRTLLEISPVSAVKWASSSAHPPASALLGTPSPPDPCFPPAFHRLGRAAGAVLPLGREWGQPVAAPEGSAG